jgi:hypothetical protein
MDNISTPRIFTASSHSAQSGFSYITYPQLCEQAKTPLAVPKRSAPVIAPHDADGKTKQIVMQHDNFVLLVADIDSGDHEITQLQQRLSTLELGAYLIYSTASSTDTDKRWRIIVPLAAGINATRWQALQRHLAAELDGDDCVTRINQISYAPNSGAHYQYAVNRRAGATTLDGMAAEHPFVIGARNRQRELYQQRETALSIAKTLPPACATGQRLSLTASQISPITAFNAAYSLPDMLNTLGYTSRGGKYCHPNSTSGIAGVVILNGRYFSHHSTDPLADGHTHDTFSVWMQLHHGGDLAAALREAGELMTHAGVTVTKHNRLEYARGVKS